MSTHVAAAQSQVVSRGVNALYELGVRPVQPVESINQRRFGKRPASWIQAKYPTNIAAKQRTCVASHLAPKTVSDQCHIVQMNTFRLQKL